MANATSSTNQPAGAPTLLYLIKQVELAVRSELDDLTRPEGLTALQYTALTVLEHQSDVSAAHLARHSFVTAQSMADMVNALLERGLIQRHRDIADRRRLVIGLTAEGEAVLARLRPQIAALEQRMLRLASAADATELERTLQLCRRALRTDSAAM